MNTGFYKLAMIVAAAFALSAPAHAAVVQGVGIEIKGNAQDQDYEAKDPVEDFNRGIYGFNEAVDDAFFEPVARVYKGVVPEWGRQRVGNFFDNIKEPITVINSLLQGDVENALSSFWRFTLNTTIGIGGLFDQAKYAGLNARREDFSQTLGVYGVGTGPFVMFPILGATSVRGVLGGGVDAFANPTSYLAGPYIVATRTTEGVHARSDVLELTDEIERTSFDPYATIRSAYFQREEAQVKNFNKDKARRSE